jgi:hypothetical protein
MGEETFPWCHKYSAREYIRLLGTYSDHVALTVGARTHLFEAIEVEILEAGGSIELTYDAMCYMFTRVHDA